MIIDLYQRRGEVEMWVAFESVRHETTEGYSVYLSVEEAEELAKGLLDYAKDARNVRAIMASNRAKKEQGAA